MLTVHHLENSRSHRILWLLEELGLHYEIQRYARDPKTSLAPPELLRVHPGTATPLGLMNDTENAVTLVVDEALLSAEQLNFHPMTHREHRSDLAAVPCLRGLLRPRTARRTPCVIMRKKRA